MRSENLTHIIWLAGAMAILNPSAGGQSAASATVQGSIRDYHSLPVAAATVSLQVDAQGQSTVTYTDEEGKYRFSGLRGGAFTLRVDMPGYSTTMAGPFALADAETRQVDLTLAALATDAGRPKFFDEPNFIVAGVADTNNHGGHVSEAVAHSTEVLRRAAASLNAASGAAASENSLREAVAREPLNADLHHSLGDEEEKQGKALEAVREYQRAAELNASENNLFDWGTELLTHRANDQAAEVFAKGNRLYPRSVRILLGLGAALYARGIYDQAAQRFFEAVDVNPSDPAPYLFLGKVQSVEITQLDGFLERLGRFARLQPDNPFANYYYAACLWTRWKGTQDQKTMAQVVELLEKAVRLHPALSDGYLLRGILYSELSDFSKAISSYQRAIETGTQREEVHYRLAQAYQRSGEKLKAQNEFDLYEQLRKKSAAEEEHQRNEVQQFVFTLKEPPR